MIDALAIAETNTSGVLRRALIYYVSRTVFNADFILKGE